MNFSVRKTEEKDILVVLEIYDSARKFMRSYGNYTQWSNGYPGIETLRNDIADSISYVITDQDGDIVMTFVLLEGEDPTYKIIYEGQWLNDRPYATIHRAASSGKHKDMMKVCIDFCSKISPDLRSDTHEDNIPMRKALVKHGFKKCGIIICQNGTPRVAYQKSL